jgi:hypothetical protein
LGSFALDLDFAVIWAFQHTVLIVPEICAVPAVIVEQIFVLGEIRSLATIPFDFSGGVGSKIRFAIGDERNGRKCHNNSFDHFLLIVFRQDEAQKKHAYRTIKKEDEQ